MTEAESAKEEYHQSPPKLPAAPIEKDHNEELNSIQVNKDLKKDIKSKDIKSVGRPIHISYSQQYSRIFWHSSTNGLRTTDVSLIHKRYW